MARIRYIDPIGTDLYNAHIAKVLEEARAPDTDVEVCNLDLPPELAGPMLPPKPLYYNEIVATALAAEQDGADAVIIGCCSDPALPETQRAVGIPVVGPLQAAAAVCAARGRRLGICFPDEHAWKTTAAWVRGNLRLYGLDTVVGPVRFVSMRADEEPALLGNTAVTADEVFGRFHRQLVGNGVATARALLAEDAADAILFGCTLWGGMVAEVAGELPATVLDPVVTALRMAELQARIPR